METDLGRGSEVVFGNFSFFTVPSLLLGKDAQNQLLSEIRQITKEDVSYDHILVEELKVSIRALGLQPQKFTLALQDRKLLEGCGSSQMYQLAIAA